MTITLSSVIVFFSIQNESSRKQIESNKNMRTITIVPKGEITSDILSKILSDSEIGAENLQIFSEIVKEKDFRYTFFSEMKQSQFNIFFGNRISEGNIKNFDKVVVAPASYLKNLNKKQNDIITLNGQNFIVLGENNIAVDKFEIPYTTFFTLFKIEKINIILSEITPPEEYQKIESYLKSNQILSVQQLIMPKYDEELLRRMSSDLIFCILVFGLAFINLSYMYRYILEKRKKIFSVYKISGCNNKIYISSLILENVFLYTASFIFAYLLSVMINSMMFPWVLEIKAISVIKEDSLFLYFVLLLILILGIAFVIGNFIKKSPITQYKESGE